jgi:hypothetical protein
MSKPHEHTNKLERGRKTAISENVIMGFIVLPLNPMRKTWLLGTVTNGGT